MSKPYSDVDFSAQITEDRSWRLREISDLKTAVTKADANLGRVLMRALVTVCYAHWEGYVRFTARKYLEHVALRKFQFQELNRQFLRNYFMPRLSTLSKAKTSMADRCALIDEILDSGNRRFARANDDLVQTKANLNFDVLSDICLVCGVPISAFENKATFIDVLLLKRRNDIAHGEDTFVGVGDLDELASETVTIMRTFGDELENHVVTQDYKSA
jgi:hypothetical protein